MEKLLKKLSSLHKDKLGHFFVGFFVFVASLFFSSLFARDILAAVFYAICITTFTAVAKEIYDYFNRDKHTPEVADILYTVLPSVFITITVFWLHLKF